VVKQDTIAGKHPVSFPVVLGNPETVLFGHSVGRAGIEGGGFFLRYFLHLSVEFRSGSLVDAGFLLHTQDAYSLQYPQGSHGIRFCCVFRHIEGYFHMALSRQVVDFVGLHGLDDANERAAVGHVAVVQLNLLFLLHILDPLVEVQMFYACGVEIGCPAQHPMNFVSFLE